jgi:hypothetical protein
MTSDDRGAASWAGRRVGPLGRGRLSPPSFETLRTDWPAEGLVVSRPVEHAVTAVVCPVSKGPRSCSPCHDGRLPRAAVSALRERLDRGRRSAVGAKLPDPSAQPVGRRGPVAAAWIPRAAHLAEDACKSSCGTVSTAADSSAESSPATASCGRKIEASTSDVSEVAGPSRQPTTGRLASTSDRPARKSPCADKACPPDPQHSATSPTASRHRLGALASHRRRRRLTPRAHDAQRVPYWRS